MNLPAILAATFNAIAPVFAMVLLGVWLKKRHWIDARFIHTASMLVFRGAMPTLLFLALIDADMSQALNPAMMGYLALATLAAFILIWWWAARRVAHEDRGVYVQAGFRGNGGILGLAIAHSLYGTWGLSAGSMLVATLIPLYNALSVIVLAHYQPGASADWRSIVKKIVTNPLILAVAAGLGFAASGLSLPGWLHTSGRYFADITLPLALIGIGGTLSVTAVREASGTALGAGLAKMVWGPLLLTALAGLVGFEGRELVMLFIFLASPTAAASFVMAGAMGGNARLAANVIALTTLAGALTVPLGIVLLRLAGHG